jgi:outer membrane protein OmpA-like peptidoglycan-associated protein
MVGPYIYTTTDKGKILCIQSSSGKVKWQFQAMHKRRGKILSTANGRAYFTVWDRVYSLAEGALPKTDKPIQTGPLRRIARANKGNPTRRRYSPSRRYRPRRSYRNNNRYSRPHSRKRYGRDRLSLRRPPYSRYRRKPHYSSPDKRTPGYSYRRKRNPDRFKRQPSRTGNPDRVAIAKPRKHDIEPDKEPVTEPKTKLIKGKMVDSKTGKPIKGEIVAIPREDKQGKKRIHININGDGSFNFKIPDKDYDITFRSPGYSFTTIPVKEKEKWKKRKIKLEKLEPGTKFVLSNVFFEVHKATLKPGSIKELRSAVRLLRENPNLKIEITGHTDSTGSRKYNFYFSKKRAEVVHNFLIKHGISPQRLKIRGAGPTEPIATNKTKAGRAKNRRVEFKVIE